MVGMCGFEAKSKVQALETRLWDVSESGEPAARSRSYSLRSPNRELRAASAADPVTVPPKTGAGLNNHKASVGAGARTARYCERSECEGSRAPAPTLAFREERKISTPAPTLIKTQDPTLACRKN
jgi:hypothetical protein